MVEQLCLDIANSLRVELDDEINPIRTTAENISTRLLEIETVFFPKSLAKETLSAMLAKKADLEMIYSKIDSVEQLMDDLKANLETLEEQVGEAEAELNIPTSGGIFNRLNSILSSKSSISTSKAYNRNSKSNYHGAEICRTETYFENDSQK